MVTTGVGSLVCDKGRVTRCTQHRQVQNNYRWGHTSTTGVRTHPKHRGGATSVNTIEVWS